MFFCLIRQFLRIYIAVSSTLLAKIKDREASALHLTMNNVCRVCGVICRLWFSCHCNTVITLMIALKLVCISSIY